MHNEVCGKLPHQLCYSSKICWLCYQTSDFQSYKMKIMFLQAGMHAKMTNKCLRFIGLYTIPKEKYKAQDTNISLNDSSH